MKTCYIFQILGYLSILRALYWIFDHNLENKKVMVHYNILLSYWIIQNSQLRAHWIEMESEYFDTIKGPAEPLMSKFGCVDMTNPPNSKWPRTHSSDYWLGHHHPFIGRRHGPRNLSRVVIAFFSHSRCKLLLHSASVSKVPVVSLTPMRFGTPW